MKTKNIIIIIAAVVIVGGAWAASSRLIAPRQEHAAPYETATSTRETVAKKKATTTADALQTRNGETTASSTAAGIQKKPATPPRIVIDKPLFHYDIIPSKTPCNDLIGAFTISSSDPSKQLYWGMTGTKPIWLTFSSVEGSTPATVDMRYNCILSGAEDMIDWRFTVVEMTKDGTYVDGYYRSVSLTGAIKKE